MKTVIEMAREAGFAEGIAEIVGLHGFERFAELVRADEREACAKVCENEWSTLAESKYGEVCADAIRARSNT